MLAPVYDAHELESAIKVRVSHLHGGTNKTILRIRLLLDAVVHFDSVAHAAGNNDIINVTACSQSLLLFSCICSPQGAGTEEACLIDILASRTNDEIKAINAFYTKSKRLPSAH